METNEYPNGITGVGSLGEFLTITQPAGDPARALSNNLYGLSNNGIRGALPENKDSHGLVFFTRPQLNLSSSNIKNYRRMYSLLSEDSASVARYVRCVLDPRLAITQPEDSNLTTIRSDLMNEFLPFIPVFTNNIKTVSGWPDLVLPTFTSKEGLRKEQWSIGDGAIEIYNSFDLDCVFKNTKDEPITTIIDTWLSYIANVFEGTLSPYLDMITENEIDYNTRIYRLVMDETQTYVKKIAATGASFPVNVPSGKMFDYTEETKYNDQTKDINIRFKCNGAMYNDAILIDEFNKTVGVFNPEVRNMLYGRSHNLERIPTKLTKALNFRGIPLINKNTLALEWWISKNSLSYKKMINLIKGDN